MADEGITRSERQVETRRCILTAAARVFAEHGYHGASVHRIAAAAGFTTGAIYSNFGGKEDLFIALLDAHVERYLAALDQVSGGTDPRVRQRQMRERVADLVDRMSGPQESEPGGTGLSTRQMMMLSLEFLLYVVRERPDLHRSLAERWRAVDARTRALFRRMQSTGSSESPTLNPDELALAEACFVEGLGLRLLYDPELISPSDAGILFEKLFLPGRNIA